MEDQLHLRDLDTDADRVVATGAVGDVQREGAIPGFNVARLAGDWAVWLDGARAGAAGTIRGVNVVTGAGRTMDAGGSSCAGPTAGTRYVAWYCSGGVSRSWMPLIFCVSRGQASAQLVKMKFTIET